MTKHFPSLLLSSFAAVFLTQACSCDPATGDITPPPPMCTDPQVMRNDMCCSPPTEAECPLGEICMEGAAEFDPNDMTGCATICNTCIPNLLNPGVLSQQLDMTQTAAGAVVLSGFSPGDSVYSFLYGDLVFGEYDETTQEVEWSIVDGVPPGPTDGSYSAQGWREGQYLPGDEVGRYSSIVANGENILISYEDTTHHSLKVAIRNNGTWTTHTVEDIDDTDDTVAGGALYTSIALDATNKPVIAYGVRVPATSATTQPTGWVNVAVSSEEYPDDAGDWTVTALENTLVEVGCIQGDGLCHADATCVSIGARGHCVPKTGTNDCTTTCNSGFICDNGACAETRKLGDLIDAQGLYNNLVRVADGFALAYYDRSVTRQVASSTGGVVMNTNLYVRTAGDALNASMVGKPIRIAGLPGTRSVVSVAANTITFSGTASATTLVGAAAQHYDGTGGTVWGTRLPDADADWSDQATFAIEGFQTNPAAPAAPIYGDCGISTSLFVDGTGVWHVAFVDGTYERLRYVKVLAGATTVTAANRTTVDDGYPGANRPQDRPMLGGERRIIGDGASIVVTSTGDVRIAYQDTTSIYAVNAVCTTGAMCTRAPTACVTKANCNAVGAASECNQGLCSNPAWVSSALSTLPDDDTNFSPNEGYYTVQIVDAETPGGGIVAWLARALQPEQDEGTTTVVRVPTP